MQANSRLCRRKFASPGGPVDKVLHSSGHIRKNMKKDARWRHPVDFIIRFRFKAVADKRQWSSAASRPRRTICVKLWLRFWAENEPSHQICRSRSASRYAGVCRLSRFSCRAGVK